MRGLFVTCVVFVALLFCQFGAGQGGTVPQFESAQTCAQCHQKQHREWEGSMMHYSAQSPVFQAFEVKARKMTGRFGPHDRDNPTFCINCHAPTAAYGNEMIGLLPDEASIHTMSKISKEGISCTVCHSVRKPALNHIPEKGFLGDSLANADLVFFPTQKLVGPTRTEPLPERVGFHTEGFSTFKKSSEYLTSSEFCGSCHNVNLPQSPDVVRKTPFQIEQSTFTEWKESAYSSEKSPLGKPVSCVDCHMSQYGTQDPVTGVAREPGTFPIEKVAKGYSVERKHASHRFTAASVSLLGNHPDFPRQEENSELREALLKKACRLSANTLQVDSHAVRVRANIVNTGAGHHVPTGLSQERELWLEVTASEKNSGVFFESGTLRDAAHPETGERAPDGRVSDEDLRDWEVELDSRSLEIRKSRLGPDLGLRPFAPRGLAKFSNAFLRKRSEADFEHVLFFAKADHVDNSRSLPVLKPVSVDYEIPLLPLLKKDPGFCGEIDIRFRLLYRSFRPKLLRALAHSEKELLNEQMVDRNQIVTMNEQVLSVSVCLGKIARGMEQGGSVSVSDQIFEFKKASTRWVGFYQPEFWEEADLRCKQISCQLPSVEQYDSLGFAEYVPVPGDNQDEFWKARWTSQKEQQSASTYTFGWKDQRVQPRATGPRSLSRYPFFCVCSEAGK